jgi:hypothetical protein
MIPVLVAALILIVGLAAGAVPVDAGTQPQAVVALHAKSHRPPSPETACDVGRPTVPCREYRVTWPIESGADVYLVVARAYPGPGIAGVSCGISYNATLGAGVDVLGWTLCADLEFRNAGPNGEWPASEGGNRITWVPTTNCQRTVINPDGVHAIAGAFYVYAYSMDTFLVTANKNLAGPYEFAVADCAASITYLREGSLELPAAAACLVLGAPGYNPCVGATTVPVDRTTWGKLKTKY